MRSLRWIGSEFLHRSRFSVAQRDYWAQAWSIRRCLQWAGCILLVLCLSDITFAASKARKPSRSQAKPLNLQLPKLPPWQAPLRTPPQNKAPVPEPASPPPSLVLLDPYRPCLWRDMPGGTGAGLRWSMQDGFGLYVQGAPFKHLRRLANYEGRCSAQDNSPYCYVVPLRVCK